MADNGPLTVEQRVLTALRRQQPDRVPVFVYLDPESERWYIKEPSYKAVLSATKDLADVIYDWHFPGGTFLSAVEPVIQKRQRPDGITEQILETPRGPLTHLAKSDWRGGGEIKRWITTVEDAKRALSLPYKPLRPDLAPFLRQRDARKNTAVAQATFNDPICIAAWIAEEAMAMWTIDERPLLRELLEMCFERIRDGLQYCLEGGVGPIYYFNGPEFALPPLMSPRDFEEFVVAYDTRLIAQIHSFPDRCVIVHSHGRVSRFLERFAAMGMDGLNVLEPPPLGDTLLADAKRRIGERVCLIGNVQYDDIARGAKADVERLVRAAIRDGGPGGGFILSPCASPYEVTLTPQTAENLVHYLEVARRYGTYPLGER